MQKRKKGKEKVKRRSGKGFRTISSKILTFIGGTMLLSFVILLLIITRITSDSVTKLRDDELAAQSEAAANDINSYFVPYFEAASVIAKNSAVEALVTEATGNKKMDQASSLKQVVDTLHNIQSTGSESVMSIVVADVDTSQFVANDGSFSAADWVITSRPWFQELEAAGEPIMSAPYLDVITNKQVVGISAPIFKKGTTQIIGAVNIDLALDDLGKMASSYKLGETGRFLLASGNGQIIYHPNADLINKNVEETDFSDNLKQALLSGKTGNLSYKVDGEQTHGCVAAVGSTGWTLTTGMPDKEYNQSYTAVRNTTLIIFIIVFVIVTVVVLLLSRQIVTPIKRLTDTANLIADGDLNVTVDVKSADETGRMGESLNRTVVQLRRYIAYIKEITGTLENMAQGDMRIHLQEDYVGEFASIRTAFGAISASLNHALHLINDTAEQVSVGADQVSNGAQALAAGSSEQAASIEELSASVTTIAEQAEENSGNVRTATEFVVKTSMDVAAGNEHMTQLTEAMSEIGSASDEIANITKVIEDIAFQTNILALNAAIEAARAGDAGKGFAVVADEVRSLAAKSAEAAKQTADLIHHSVITVSKGTQITSETAKILQQVELSTLRVTESFTKIEAASEEQATAIEQVKLGLAQVSSVVQTNAATAEENSATSEEMSAQATTLREEVGRFKLEAATKSDDFSVVSHESEEFETEEFTSDSSFDFGKY
jgi:methyl-accepting chemotaxis protein